MADVVTLAEAFVHPALVATAHILVAILIVGRVIVHIVEASFGVAGTAAHNLAIIIS